MIDIASGIIGRLWVQGRPRTKGSLKCLGSSAVSKHVLVEDHKLSKPWRNTMTNAVRALIAEYMRDSGPLSWEPYAGAVEVRLTFFFEREIGVSGNVVPSSQSAYPYAMTIGDLDKLDRNVLDALVGGGLIADDRYVCRIVSDKRWAAKGNPGGVQIHVLRYPADVIDVTAIDRDAKQYFVGIEGSQLWEKWPND